MSPRKFSRIQGFAYVVLFVIDELETLAGYRCAGLRLTLDFVGTYAGLHSWEEV